MDGSETDDAENTNRPADSASAESSENSDASEPTEPEKSYRETISMSREELEAMLTLSDEDFALAENYLKDFKAIAIVSSDYDEVDAAYLLFEDA